MKAHTRKHKEPDTNKERGEWFFRRSTYPLRDAPPLALEAFWDNIDHYAHAHRVEWQEMGPRNYPGRVTCLVRDPNSGDLFAGAAAGGVWKSIDRGDNWFPAWPKLLSQHIGALAIHPTDSACLYCATGEANLSADSYAGSGVYQTRDCGMTWIPSFVPAVPGQGGVEPMSLPRRIGALTFGRFAKDDYRIALGAVSSSEALPAALYLDEGDNGLQPCTFWGDRNYNCHSVVFHPRKSKTLYVAIEPRGPLNGIWRSEDFGRRWVKLVRGLPPGEDCGRISLAISPSDPDVLYALVASRAHGAQGVYRSRNGGESWKETGARHFANEVNLAYNNTIAVHPKDPEFVLAGAKNLHLTLDGGRSWKRVSTDQRDGAGGKLPRDFVHPDHHSVIITSTGVLYSGNDGGVARSENCGVSWQTSSEGMVTAMFYAAGVSQRDSRIFGGGTQDNGTLIAGVPDTASAPAPAEGHFTRVLAGDGGWIEFDPKDTEHVFGSTSDLILNRHRKGEPWAHGPRLARWTNVSPPPHLLLPGEKEARSIIVMEMAGRRLYCGTTRLWRTDIHRQTWKPVSPFLDGSAISAIEVSPHDPAVLFAGTSQGCIFRSCNGGGTWSSNLAGPAVAQRVITRIAIHPAQPRTVVIAVAATGNPGARLVRSDDPDQSGETTPYSHVLLSNDLGQTWLPLERGDHPDVVINALVFETHPPYRLFVGGDAGVWFREDLDPRSVGGFISISGNMPNVVVSDLSFHHNDKFLYAATYGRGIWRCKVDGPSPEAETFDDRTHRDSPPAVGLIPDESAPAPKLLSPPDGAVIAFPGTTTLKWTPVPGAIAYSIETVYPRRTAPFSSPGPELTFKSQGMEPFFWRVWAILPGSRRSPGSKSRKLRYSG